MISYRAQGLRFLHTSFQCLTAILLLWIWKLLIGFITGQPPIWHERYAVYSFVIALAFAFQTVHAKAHSPLHLNWSLNENFRYSLWQTVTVFLCISLFLVATKDQAISRKFLFSYLPLLFCLFFYTNRHMPEILAIVAFNGQRQQSTLVLGSRERALQCLCWLRRKATYGLRMIGLVELADPPAPSAANGVELPVLGNVCQIEEILAETKAAQIILLELPSPEQIKRLGELCDRLGVRLLMINDLPEKLQQPLSFMEDDGMQLLALRHEPLEDPVNRIVKRTIDISISLPVVLFILPVAHCIVFILHRLQSPGPLFFRQPRTGFANEEFLIYKYRTMHVGNRNEAVQASVDDPRVFPAARWLRKHSIDELPQFLNVLKGEMSVVGPRPHLPEHSRQFNEAAHGFKIRSLIKPGITGLAQVEGFRGETKELKDLTNRVRSDIYYLENWSFPLESAIIARTARQIFLPPKAAY